MAGEMIARAELYAALAEALAEPPLWLADAGRAWPLFEAAVRVARETGSEAARHAVEALAGVGPESLPARRGRYQRLFTGPGRPAWWFYESLYVNGRLLGPAALAVAQIYRAAGLDVAGTELPDHASVELAFLAWLAEQAATDPAQSEDWQALARRFIERHAGRWLPQLGRALAASGDPVYAPIGQLLAGWLAELKQPSSQRAKTGLRRPTIPQTDTCTLCGFCVQLCPTQALSIRETGDETMLALRPAACIGCGKCERACDFGALRMITPDAASAQPIVLRLSPRVICPGCGRPTVSQAEVAAVAAGLGYKPAWLDYCLACRAEVMECV